MYVVLIGVAAFVRFFALDRQPLSTSEAATSWAAWVAALGLRRSLPEAASMSEALPPTSPLLYSLQGLLFWIAGGSDIQARFWPAVAGTMLVLFIWFVRQEIGRYAALALALFVAIDPWQVAYSRIAQGTILSAFFGLTALFSFSILTRRDLTSKQIISWRTTCLVSSGLLLISGPQSWNFILLLGLFFLLNLKTQLPRRLGLVFDGSMLLPSSTKSTPHAQEHTFDAKIAVSDSASGQNEDGEEDASTADPASTAPIRSVGLVAAVVLLGATGWLIFPEGLSFLATSLTVWVTQFVGDGANEVPLYSLKWGGLRLIADAPMLLMFGGIGLLGTWLDRRRAESRMFDARFLMLWTAYGMLLLLLPGRNPHGLLMIHLPLLLAAARIAGHVLRSQHLDRSFTHRRREVQAICLALTVLVIIGTFVLSAQVASSELSFTLMLTLLMVLALALFLVVMLALLTNWRLARRTTAIYGGGLLLLITLGSSWRLNHPVDLLAPSGFFHSFTSPEVRMLTQDIQTLSAHRTGDPEEIDIHAQMEAFPDPLLAWYLRTMRNLQWSRSPTAVQNQSGPLLLLTLQNDVSLRSAADTFLGSDYDLRLFWLPDRLLLNPTTPDSTLETRSERINQRWNDQIQPLMRWLIYRKIEDMPPAETVILWTQGT